LPSDTEVCPCALARDDTFFARRCFKFAFMIEILRLLKTHIRLLRLDERSRIRLISSND
jgi:hypothetical protein